MPYAEIVFNLPLDHAYTYRIPQDVDSLQPGMRVLVPFGKRTITGMVVRIIKKTSLTSLKEIIDVLDEHPLLSKSMLELTRWIADYYLAAWGQAIYMALPKGIDTQQKERLHLLVEDPHVKLTERQKDLYLIIGEQPGNSADFYRKKFGQHGFHYFAAKLESKGLIRRERYFQGPRVGALVRKFVCIPVEYETLKTSDAAFVRYIEKRPEIDAYFRERVGKEILMAEFLKETGMAASTLKRLRGKGICPVVEKTIQRHPEFNYTEAEKVFELTDEQQKAVETIGANIRQSRFHVFLLHGVTGSGKTQVYIEALKETIQKGKNAIVLIPEIALTPQTVARFRAVGGEAIAVFHSKMSAGERFDAWMACYQDKIKVVIGPRSALFAPLKNVGLIVVDEEHENTYKQTDTVPRYHARDVAVYWAKMNHATVVLGSATPSLESFYNARRGKYTLLEILNRVDNIRMPDVYLVDMKRKRVRIGHEVTLFSQELADKIQQRLERNEQVILLQNRRGYSSFMQCKECGYIPVCPNCDVSLTYHSYNEQMQCHLCGHRQQAVHECPACGGKQIAYKGIGTQRIHKELAELFPKARILRMDQDTTKGKNSHSEILQAFGDRQADILLGTQMIAKGLDFENVTLVGVISADVGLAIPDFRSAERVFQLLTQVAGRSGRGQKQGEVVVQSYLYSHFSIQLAKEHDYTGFYMQEMQHRRDYRYPPFFKMIQVVVSSVKMSEAIALSRKLAVIINRRIKNYAQVIGPSPAALSRVNNLFRWQIALKLNPKTDPNGQHSKKILQQVLEPYLSRRTADIHVTVDVDPLMLS